MKLFLASLANVTLDLVKPLLPADPHQLKLAFIPTAADPYPVDTRPWLDADRQKAIDMGFSVTNYDIKGKSHAQHLSALASFDVIFVTGGNTYYLLNEIKKSGFDLALKELIQNGKIYVGSSAGSCIMCPTIDHVELVEHKEVVPEMQAFDGLGLVSQLILPHYGRSKYADRHGEILAHRKYGSRILPLRDDQALVVDRDLVEVVTLQGETL